MKNRVCPVGSRFDVRILFTNEGRDACRIYDPFFTGTRMGCRPAACFALFDAQKDYVGDLLAFERRSTIGLYEALWLTLPAGAVCGCSFTFTAGCVPRTPYIRGRELSPGKYYLQAIYFDRFASDCPFGESEQSDMDELLFGPDAKTVASIGKWRSEFKGRELFRSNTVEIELVAQRRKDGLARSEGVAREDSQASDSLSVGKRPLDTLLHERSQPRIDVLKLVLDDI